MFEEESEFPFLLDPHLTNLNGSVGWIFRRPTPLVDPSLSHTCESHCLLRKSEEFFSFPRLEHQIDRVIITELQY